MQIYEGFISDAGPHLHLMGLWQIFQVTLCNQQLFQVRREVVKELKWHLLVLQMWMDVPVRIIVRVYINLSLFF